MSKKSTSLPPQGAPTGAPWTFLSNHAHVMICLHREPDLRLKDVATLVGITERAVQRMVADLTAAGVLEVQRVGRRNQYRIDGTRPLRHPVEAHRVVQDILRLAK
jgi:Mn-dependent DtxR family transcriptional regulator